MAERALATAYVNIVPGTQAVEQYLKGGLPGVAGGAGNSAGAKFSSGFSGRVKGMIGSLGVAFGAIGLVNFTRDLVAAGQAEEVSNKRLEQIAQSMGIFGDSSDDVSKRLQDLSGTMQMQLGIDDDIIKSTQAKLLTFKELAKTADEQGGAFDRATQAALDLAAAGFGSAEGNAVQLGKALQDPIKGITALARSGVTFTKQEKDRIKTLVESNKMGEAQALVLKAIETQVGGTAAATTTSSDKMAQGWSQVQETVGLMLLPALDDLATFLNDEVFPKVKQFFQDFKDGKTPLNDIIDGIKDFIGYIKDNWTWVSTLGAAVLSVAAAIKLATMAYAAYNGILALVSFAQGVSAAATAMQSGATFTATAAQWGFNAALLANPLTWVVLAVIALIGALVWFFTQTEVGKKAWKNFTAFLGSSMKAIGKFFGDVWEGIKVAFMSVFEFIAGAFRGYVNMWIGFINFIIDGLNSIKFDIPDWVPVIGGQSFGINLPKIPMLAEGGFVNKPTQAIIGEAGPEVVTPLKDFERMMGLTESKDRPIYADGIGLIGMIRETAKGQAQLVFNDELGKVMRGAR